MDDANLRPEFVNQMKALRNKIFKRVKPKMLSNTIITGESLLDLAIAYVNAINNGGVPCIESAWTSVCKSEC
jgi:hypothetical protein